MLVSLSLLLPLLLPVAPPPQAPDGEAARLLRRVEDHHARITDLVARFSQSYRSGLLGREVTETGTVAIKRPGRMRWDYENPEKKTFVSDGKTFYFHVPADRQVIVSEQDERRSLAGRLLSGRQGLSAEFAASVEATLGGGVVRLKLLPRAEQPDLEVAFVDVEPSGRVISIQIEDLQGNRTRFHFERVRENTGVKDDLFRFRVPDGVEVIRG